MCEALVDIRRPLRDGRRPLLRLLDALLAAAADHGERAHLDGRLRRAEAEVQPVVPVRQYGHQGPRFYPRRIPFLSSFRACLAPVSPSVMTLRVSFDVRQYDHQGARFSSSFFHCFEHAFCYVMRADVSTAATVPVPLLLSLRVCLTSLLIPSFRHCGGRVLTPRLSIAAADHI